MDINEWWGLVGQAREAAGDRADDRDPPDDPLPGALTGVLAALEPARIVDFAVTAYEVTASAYRWPLWNAAYLIEGGCGDDGFTDFRDGLVLLGREVFTRAVADPDSLAGLPVVVRMSRGESGWIGYESLAGQVKEAYARAGGAAASTRPWRRPTGAEQAPGSRAGRTGTRRTPTPRASTCPGWRHFSRTRGRPADPDRIRDAWHFPGALGFAGAGQAPSLAALPQRPNHSATRRFQRPATHRTGRRGLSGPDPPDTPRGRRLSLRVRSRRKRMAS